MKIELNKAQSEVTQLEEMNLKMESELNFMASENERLNMKFQDLSGEDSRVNSIINLKTEEKLRYEVQRLSQELEEAHENFIPMAELEQVQKKFDVCQTKLRQSQREIAKKEEVIKRLQSHDLRQSLNASTLKENESPNQLKSMSPAQSQEFRETLRDWKDGSGLPISEVQKLQQEIVMKDSEVQALKSEVENLRGSLEIIQANRNSLGELEEVIRQKDEIISKLKTSIENPMDKAMRSQEDEAYVRNSKDYSHEELTLGAKKSSANLHELLLLVNQFFEQATDLEINEFLNAIKMLCDRIEEESLSHESRQEFERQMQEESKGKC